MRWILTIQTLALGDLMMMTPLWAGLKARQAEDQVQVLANTAFRRVVENNPDVDEFIGFPYQELYRAANQEEAAAVPQTLEGLARFSQEMPTGHDLVINPCFNNLGAALTRLAQPRQVVGADFSREGNLVMRGDWAAYCHTFLDEPAWNTFHQADILCLAAGVKPPEPGLVFHPTDEERAYARRLLARLGARQGEKIVALQVGGGREPRLWPLESFAALARHIQQRGLRVLFTGIASERPMIQRAAAELGDEALIAAGRTDIGQLAALLELCQALVSNDTGTIHLAAAMDLPTVSISLATVQFRNTGPYRPGSLALEADLDCAPCADASRCPHRKCRQAITPDDALAALGYLLGYQLKKPAGSKARFHRARLGDDGWLDWQSLPPHPNQEQLQDLRRAWLRVLGPGPEPKAPEIPPAPPTDQALVQLDRLAAQAMVVLGIFAREAGGGDLTRLQLAAQELSSLSKQIIHLGVEHPVVKPLAIYFVRRLAGLDQADMMLQVSLQKKLFTQIQAACHRPTSGAKGGRRSGRGHRGRSQEA